MSAEVEKLKRALQFAHANYDYSHDLEKLSQQSGARMTGALEARTKPDESGVSLGTTDAFQRGRGSGAAKLSFMPDELKLKYKDFTDRENAKHSIGLGYKGAESAASAAGAGRIVVPGGVQNPGIGGTVPNTSPGESLRQPNSTQQKELEAMDAAVAQAEELAKSVASKDAPTIGGKALKWWTEQATTDPTGVLKKFDKDAPRRAAFMQNVGQNQLANLRSIFGARITNMDMIFGKEIEPTTTDDNETLKWKTNQMSSRAKAASSILRQSLQGMGVAAGPDGRITIPPELIQGLTTGASGPAGTLRLPGQRAVQVPSGPPSTPAQSAPRGIRTLTPEEVEALQ